jgi:protein-tyrosine phosphatase
MVCLGNICRSPIAEGVMRDKIKLHDLQWTVASAGTNSYHTGEPPHRFSQKVCMAHGIDISGLRAKRFTPADFTNYDKIYAFADDVFREIRSFGGSHNSMDNVDYFLNELYYFHHAGNEVKLTIDDWKITKNASVPDPYYGGEDGYHLVYELIDRTCNTIIENHKKQTYV